MVAAMSDTLDALQKDAAVHPGWKEVARDTLDLLTFRISRERLRSLGNRHLQFGLLATWVVGIGRWWDDPSANVFQHLGVGSVAYVFVLALLLHLVVAPIGPEHWGYRRILTLITLTAPPAILYAIPVELFLGVDVAAAVNAWFLAIVATWRVSLLVFYLRRGAGLDRVRCVVGTFLPLAGIVSVLTWLNLAQGTVAVMGGLRETTSSDITNWIVMLLSVLSTLLLPVFGLAWIVLAVITWRRSR